MRKYRVVRREAVVERIEDAAVQPRLPVPQPLYWPSGPGSAIGGNATGAAAERTESAPWEGGPAVKWASAISEQVPLTDALDECIVSLQPQLDGEEPDLVLVFASPHHDQAPQALAKLADRSTVGKVVLVP